MKETFKKIYVIPLYPDKSVLNYKAENIEVIEFNFFQPVNRIKILTGNFLQVLKIFLLEFSNTHNKTFYIKNFITNLNDLLLKFGAAKNLEKIIKKDINSTTVFYSYWFMQWMAALSILKLKNPGLKIVSRVHGADYDEGQIKRTLPFRYFQLSKSNKIFPVSLFAKKYLQDRFNVLPGKIEVSRLGLILEEKLAPINKGELHIVSCSSVIPLKRVDLIVDILSHLTDPVKWTHFGDGPLFDKIKQKAATLPDNITTEFKGYVSNKIFIEYLRNNTVSVFINVSESEGIPVTMMEAIAFGIPLVGTNICGVPEIVTEKTGLLIAKDFNAKDVAEKIYASHIQAKIYENSFRTGIQNFYRENFSAQSNYKNLAKELATL